MLKIMRSIPSNHDSRFMIHNSFSYLCKINGSENIMKYTIAAILCAVCLVACGGRSGSAQKKSSARNNPKVETAVQYGYRIVGAYPHDTGAYTQGLFWHDGFLYESTGEYGHSSLRKVVLETGLPVKQVPLDDAYFGEGAALYDGRIYQLTWLEGTAFVYDLDTFEKVREFNYGGEGWGVTTDGTKLYVSDGSPNIAVVNPQTFKTERTIQVRNGGKPVQYVNELEWIGGKIWANVYMTEDIIIFDPETGAVDGVIDFRGIESQLMVTRGTDVMNGIAHDPATGRIFVTGKKWNKLFEVEIFKK